MSQFFCKQKGCTFNATEIPELCPVCGNPLLPINPFSEESSVIYPANSQGYIDGKKYLDTGEASDAPEYYSDEEKSLWHDGYATAIESETENEPKSESESEGEMPSL